MYNLCFGMKVINITQLPGGNKSHPNYAMDLAGSDTGIDFWYSQGRWKCVKKTWLRYHTFMFVPVDKNGDPTKVHLADGTNRIVTLALTHSDSSAIRNAYGNLVSEIKVGKIYENGVPMYQEGTEGNATGNHIHLEVAEGIQTSKYWDSKLGVYRMRNELDPTKVFFINTSFSTIKNLRGAVIQKCSSVVYSEPKAYLHSAYKPFRIRTKPVDGDILTQIPIGYKAEVLEFNKDIQSDNYEWLKVNFNGLEGYSQLDLYKSYTLSSSESYPGLYLYARYQPFRLRKSVVNGTVLKTVPVGKSAEIIEFVDKMQSDGYQWAKCKYDGKIGYSQLDVKKCYTIAK